MALSKYTSITLQPTGSAVTRVLLALLATYTLVWLGVQTGRTAGFLFSAAFVALVLSRPTDAVAAKFTGGRRRLAAAAVLATIAATVSLVVYAVVPLLVSQARQLIRGLPQLVETLSTSPHWLAEIARNFNLDTQLAGLYEFFGQGLAQSAEAIILFANTAITSVVLAVVFIALVYLMIIEGPYWLQTLDKLLPPSRRRKPIARKLYRAVTGFVTGQIVITSISATATLIMLLLLGVPSPLALAAVIWVTGLIPLIGNTLGAVVVITIALSQSFLAAIILAVFYVIYQQVENNVLEPIIQARTIHMTPLLVIISAVIGIHMAGFVGALLALPVGGSVKILVEEYIHRYYK